MIKYSPLAKREYARCLADLAAKNEQAARHLAHRVLSDLKLVAQGMAGPIVTLKSGVQLRKLVVAPLVFYYERRGKTVLIGRVRHQREAPITHP